jgi:hypothetical protein
VRRLDAAARGLRDVVRSEGGSEGVTEAMLARWAARHIEPAWPKRWTTGLPYGSGR